MNKWKIVLLPIFVVVAVLLASALFPGPVTEEDDDPQAPYGSGTATLQTTVGFYGPDGEPVKIDDSWATLSTLRQLNPLDGGGDTKYPTELKEYLEGHTVSTYSCQIHKITVVGKNTNPQSLNGNWVVRFIKADGSKVSMENTRRYFKASDFKIEGNSEKFTATWFPTDKAIFTIPLRKFGMDHGLDWAKDGFTWTFQIEADFYGTSLAGKPVMAKPFGKKYGIRTSPVYPETPDYGTPSLVATVETYGQGDEPTTNPADDLLYSYRTCDPTIPGDCLDARVAGPTSVLPLSGSSIMRALVLFMFLAVAVLLWKELPIGRRN